MTSPRIRSATQADIDSFYGDDAPGASMRAIVADLDGKIIGIAGMSYHDGQMTAFSAMRDEMKKYPVTTMKAARRFTKMLDQYGHNVLAVASCDIEGSSRFLEHVGFTFSGITRDGRVYKWGQR